VDVEGILDEDVNDGGDGFDPDEDFI